MILNQDQRKLRNKVVQENNIDISIIVPVYNAEKYLPRCIESIQKQSYGNYEVLLINDGSVDSSADLCLNYQQQDCRVRYIYQDNSGVAAARNKGISQAKGKYIAFLDNDDYLNRDFCKQIMEQNGLEADILLFRFINVYSNQEIQKYLSDTPCNTKCTTFFNKGEYLQMEMFCPTSEIAKQSTIVFPWGKAYKRQFLSDHQIFFDSRIKLCEDVYLNLKAYEKARKVVYVDYPAYFYFHNTQSAGKSFNPQIVEIEANNIQLLDEYVYSVPRAKEYLVSYDNCLCFRYWSCCFAYFVHPDNKKNLYRIIREMKEFEQRTNIRRAFKTLPKIRNAMENKEWLFLMAVKYHLYLPILAAARKKMKKSRK